MDAGSGHCGAADCWKAVALAAAFALSEGPAAGQGDGACARECPSCTE